MPKYYGHHPSKDVGDPAEITTTTQEASANALAQANSYTDAASANLQTYTQDTSAALKEEVNNGWMKDYTFFTTITSAAPSAAYQLEILPGVMLVKANVVGYSSLTSSYGAFTLQALFYVNGGAGIKKGPTVVLFEESNDSNLFADLDVDGSGLHAEVLVQGELTDWTVTVEWLFRQSII